MDAQILIDAIDEADFTARSYSGRGMYGKQCVGVTVDRFTSQFTLGVLIAQAIYRRGKGADIEELADLQVARDSMGLDEIIYFPNVAWPDDREDES